ncbi:DNA alkylation repair protein, partial [candidate division GN15 bacterium]|nr:DNA alkylation repair protein [candidate division GN15 bacterium]
MTPKDATPPESRLWKDWVNRDRVEAMADAFAKASRSFERDAFVAAVCTEQFFAMELKNRINFIARTLRDFLPRKYGQAVKVLMKTAPEISGFENWALTSYVEQFGVEHFDESIAAMRELTKYGTAEFAIRPFMLRYLDRMMPVLHEWAEDDNNHARRLAAEGSRPRGVWVAHIEAFRKDPRPVLELLAKLKADESLYVRKAVANNLNDISRDHPELVIRTCKAWLKSKPHQHTEWIVKRACRSLIKQGHP